MPIINSTRIQGLRFALGQNKQSAFGTASSTYLMYKKLDNDITTAMLSTEDDAAEIGKGTEFADAVYPVANDFSTSINKYGTTEFVTHMWAYVLGNATIVGTGAPYAYTVVPIDPGTTIQLPQFSCVAQLPAGGASAIDNLYYDCCVEEVNVEFNSGPGRQSTKCTASIVGSGKVLSPSGVTLPTSPVTEHHMLSQSMSLVITPRNSSTDALITGSAVDYCATKRIISGQVGWKNNLMTSEGYFPGSGLQNGGAIRGRLECGARSPSFSFEARLDNNSNEYAVLVAQTVCQVVLTVQYDSNNSATWTFPHVGFEVVTNDNVNGLAAVKVSARPLNISGGVLTYTSQCGVGLIAQ